MNVVILCVSIATAGCVLDAAIRQKKSLPPRVWWILFSAAIVAWFFVFMLIFEMVVSTLKEGPKMVHRTMMAPKLVTVCDSLTKCDTVPGPNGLGIVSCHRIKGK